MSLSEYTTPIEDENLENLIFKKTQEFIEREVKDNLFNTVCNDIEQYMYERMSNVQIKLLGEIKEAVFNNEQARHDLLFSRGYDSRSFRKSIYYEYKNEIDEAIKDDALFNRISSMVNRYCCDVPLYHEVDENFLRAVFDKMLEKPWVEEAFVDRLEYKTIALKCNYDKDLSYYTERITQLRNEYNELVSQHSKLEAQKYLE